MADPTERFKIGRTVTFTPKKGKPRTGVVEGVSPFAKRVYVKLDDDPFPTEIRISRLSIDSDGDHNVGSTQASKYGASPKKRKKKEIMTTATTKPSSKELRKQAQALGIEGWEDMTRIELSRAVKRAAKATSTKSAKTPTTKAKSSTAPVTKPASKPAAKKAPAAKAKKAADTGKRSYVKRQVKDENGISEFGGKTPKELPAEGENPFRKNSNLHLIAQLLFKGGTRRSLAEQLSKKVDINPYKNREVKGKKKPVEVSLEDYDKRIFLGAMTMRNTFGYAVQTTGRGMDAKIKVFRPGGPNDPRGKSAGRTKASSGTKKASGKTARK